MDRYFYSALAASVAMHVLFFSLLAGSTRDNKALQSKKDEPITLVELQKPKESEPVIKSVETSVVWQKAEPKKDEPKKSSPKIVKRDHLPAPKEALKPNNEKQESTNVLPISQKNTVQESVAVQTAPESENNISEYFSKIEEKIKANLKYPAVARRLGFHGEGEFVFVVDSRGGIKDGTVVASRSVGKGLLDNAAIETILAAAPFGTPPKDGIRIIVPIRFELVD